jgi:hypothetical protein
VIGRRAGIAHPLQNEGTFSARDQTANWETASRVGMGVALESQKRIDPTWKGKNYLFGPYATKCKFQASSRFSTRCITMSSQVRAESYRFLHYWSVFEDG